MTVADTHTTEVEPNRYGDGFTYTAKCSCGWIGLHRWAKHNADHDAHTHQYTDGEWPYSQGGLRRSENE